MGILGIEMESAGLYLNAINAGKSVRYFTVSDHILRDKELQLKKDKIHLLK